MASKRKRASSSHPRESYDSSHFVSEEAWDRYHTNVYLENILLERNIELAYSHYDEFLHELERHHWHRNLTR